MVSHVELRAFALGAVLASILLCWSGAPGGAFQRTRLRGSFNDGILFEASAPRRALAAASTESTECNCLERKVESHGPSIQLPLTISLPIIVVMVMLSGLFSGLTLGLMGLDVIGLEIVKRGDNQALARCASKIAPVRDNGNLLLCTLLLGNVAVNSALSILTAEIASGVMGFIVSTGLIVVFGEILPQAICSRHALQVGARTVPIVKCLIASFWPLCKPMSMMLDCLLGKEIGIVHSRVELMEMLKIQLNLGAVNRSDGEMVEKIAHGAMSFRDKMVTDVMTPLEDAYMLDTETRLSYETIRHIFEQGYSRVPVYGKNQHDYRGLLYTKDLMLADPEDEMKLGDFIEIFHRKTESFEKDTKLVDALNAFKKGGTHIGLIRVPDLSVDTAPRFDISGLISLEDIMEEILQDEIVDETDVYVDVDRQIRVSDGRENKVLNLGVFNPIWKLNRDRLSFDEIQAVAAHLQRAVFSAGSDLELSMETIEWLVATGTVNTQTRASALGEKLEPKEEDWLYRYGHLTEECILVLQGRMSMRVGRDGFQTDAGAFSVLAKDALLPRDYYYPDFSACLGTSQVRFLSIQRKHFLKAQALNRDGAALRAAQQSLAAYAAGEVSRKEARDFRKLHYSSQSPHSLPASPCSNNPTLLCSIPIEGMKSKGSSNPILLGSKPVGKLEKNLKL